MPTSVADFNETLSAAIDDLMDHGFDSQERVDRWMALLAEAARRSLISPMALQRKLADTLGRVYKRSTTDAKLMRANPGVSAFTIQQVKPKLRAELDRRILASANLIRLNRDAAIAKTLQRFSGWASSVPKGGTDIAKRKVVKTDVKRGIAGLSFEERRVNIDQGHKLVAAINDIVAQDGGAIAAEWHHIAQGPPSYDSRPEHVARNRKVFVIRDSWAHKDGLIKSVNGYTDDIEQPAELPYCSCAYTYIFSLRDLPANMLTKRGKNWLDEARAKVRELAHA
jgi:hypothetical protein